MSKKVFEHRIIPNNSKGYHKIFNLMNYVSSYLGFLCESNQAKCTRSPTRTKDNLIHKSVKTWIYFYFCWELNFFGILVTRLPVLSIVGIQKIKNITDIFFLL